MHRIIACLMVGLLSGVVTQTADPFSIRAASSDAVQGWDRMTLGNREMWVAPTASLTSADIERAEAVSNPDGTRAVAIRLTEAGAEKMRELSSAQMEKLIAFMLDGRVIWAPLVRSEIGRDGVITGNGPNGLSEAVIRRILDSVKKQARF